MKLFPLFICLLFVIASSSYSSAQTTVKSMSFSQDEKILERAIMTHGGESYDQAHYSFTFREKRYTFHNQGEQFKYTVVSKKNNDLIEDIMDNSGFKRTINGKKVKLEEKKTTQLSAGLNSVIYFATLPHKLTDKAVKSSYQGKILIKDKVYHVIEITFDEKGGGSDHDDTYLYYINKQSNRIDYFSYNYTVNKGGVRFREAYNTRDVEGVLFQDYINYEAAVGTPLSELPNMWSEGKLKELSRIETEDVEKIEGE